MSKQTEGVPLYDKIVISSAILIALISLLKVGIMKAIINFVFIIVFLKTIQVLWHWIRSDL